MTAKILITGATGTIGRRVVEQMSSRRADVRAACRSANKIAAMNLPGVEAVDMDLARPDGWGRAFDGIEKVFFATPTPVNDNYVDTAARFVDAAKLSGVKHIVRLSGNGADYEPCIALARWHRIIERYIMASGLEYTMLRPSPFMQNFVNFYRPVNGAICLPLGLGKVAYIDAGDVARCAVAALTGAGHTGKAYTLTGAEALTIAEIADILSNATGKKTTYADVPEESARNAMKEHGMPALAIDALMELYAICKAGYVAGVTDAVERITGKKPTTFSAFAADHASAF